MRLHLHAASPGRGQTQCRDPGEARPMSPLLPLSAVLTVLGAFFLAVGALGLMRFPDALSRLQGVFKATSLGVGCLMVGLLLRAGSVFIWLKLLFVWGLFLVCLGYLGQLVGRSALLAARGR